MSPYMSNVLCHVCILNLLQHLQECSVLAAIVGSDVLEERRRSASESAKRPVEGQCVCVCVYVGT